MTRKIWLGLKSAIIVPLFLLFTILISAFFIAAMALRLHRVAEGIIQLWSRVFLAIPPVRLTVEGREHIDPDQQYFFMANHLSNFDIPVLFRSIPNPIRYLAKKELYKIPVFAQALKVAGIVKIDRDAGAASYDAINEGVALAKERGYSLIIFPEGTRSRDAELAPFKKGALRIALSTDLPIVPVTIHGTWDVWPPDSKVFYSGKARVMIHEPIETAQLGLSDLNALRDQIHAVIANQYAEFRASET